MLSARSQIMHDRKGSVYAGAGNTRGDSSQGWGGEHTLWCCHGTGIESTAMLPEYFAYYRCCSAPSCCATHHDGATCIRRCMSELITVHACSRAPTISSLAGLYIAMFDSYSLNKPELGLSIDVDSNLYSVRTMSFPTHLHASPLVWLADGMRHLMPVAVEFLHSSVVAAAKSCKALRRQTTWLL